MTDAQASAPTPEELAAAAQLERLTFDPELLFFDPLPMPEIKTGDRFRVLDADGRVMYEGIFTEPVPEPRVEWYGSGSGSRLVEHLLVAIADQDPDEWGDQA